MTLIMESKLLYKTFLVSSSALGLCSWGSPMGFHVWSCVLWHQYCSRRTGLQQAISTSCPLPGQVWCSWWSSFFAGRRCVLLMVSSSLLWEPSPGAVFQAWSCELLPHCPANPFYIQIGCIWRALLFQPFWFCPAPKLHFLTTDDLFTALGGGHPSFHPLLSHLASCAPICKVSAITLWWCSSALHRSVRVPNTSLDT